MRRLVIVFLAVSLCLAGGPTAAVGAERGSDVRPLQPFERVLAGMLEQLTNLDDKTPVYRRHPGGFHSLSIEIGKDGKLDVGSDREQAAASGLRLLAVGQQTGEPFSPRNVFSPALVHHSSVLSFWWAVLNSTDGDIRARTTLTVKGAGRTFLSEKERLSYPADTVSLFWFGTGTNSTPAEALGRAGTYSNKVSITGHGKRRTDFVAE